MIKRELLKAVYPGQRWTDKVNKMPDAQVTAIYYRFQRQGKLP